ncbi:PREDICTED: VITISV_013306, partial [Prunus dulcis]
QDWFHTLPSGSISSFEELAYVFTKEYTSYRTIKKNPDHLFNVHKKFDESLRDYIKRFKVERANIVGCDDQIASSAFKRGLPIECELYRELTISPRQTLIEVFATAERNALWDDDQITAKKADQAAKQESKEN